MCDTTSLCYCMGTARGDRQNGTAQYNTIIQIQPRNGNGRAKRRERGEEKSRHIRSSQVRLQREKSKPPQNKNAVEGGGGREGGSFDDVLWGEK